MRSEAASVISLLQSRGVEVQLLSGDSEQAVAAIAKQLGISHYRAECSPQAKLDAIQSAQRAGRKLCMVGDGLNDGPVLAGSDVSFAFGKAVPLAQSRADFVVVSDNLEFVQKTVMLSRKTVRIVRQNLLGSALYNAVCIPLAMVADASLAGRVGYGAELLAGGAQCSAAGQAFEAGACFAASSAGSANARACSSGGLKRGWCGYSLSFDSVVRGVGARHCRRALVGDIPRAV